MLYGYAIALVFYLVFSLAAFIGWPVTKRIFRNFTPAYIVAKIVGLALFGYLVWLAGSVKMFDYQQKTIMLAGFLILAGIFFFWGRKSKGLQEENFNFKQKLRTIIRIEAVSLLLYLAFLFVRGNNPAIYGTEKFMDMAMLTASGRTSFFPPVDSWYAGFSINYYYYGHYLFSVLSNLSHLAYNYTYNFALGILFSTCSLLAWTLIYEITKSKLASFFGTFLVIGAGTLTYAGCVVSAVFQGKAACYFGTATRLTTPSFIINEFPSYSFTVGDLHAHLIALLFFLTSLILLWRLYKEPDIRTNKWTAAALILIAATEGAINPWDLVTVTFLTGLVCLAKLIFDKRKGREFWYRLLMPAAVPVGYLVLFFLYWHRMSSQVGGLGFAPTFVSAWSSVFDYLEWPTPPSILLGVWGSFVILGVIALFFTLKSAKLREQQNLQFAGIFFFAALCIIIGTEILFIKDIYSVSNAPYFRANTVFKFGYHAWTLFSVSFATLAFIAYEKIYHLPKHRLASLRLFRLLIVFILAFSLVYPFEGLTQFYSGSANKPRTLDGADFLRDQYPTDYQAVEWINANIKQRDVLIEAAGEDYKYFGRLSAFTGMINPINWMSHEWTWRYLYPKLSWEQIVAASRSGQTIETGYSEVALRSGDVEQIYTSTDVSLTEQLLQKYHAKYVYIGPFERATYPALKEDKFKSLGSAIFTTGDSVLYELH